MQVTNLLTRDTKWVLGGDQTCRTHGVCATEMSYVYTAASVPIFPSNELQSRESRDGQSSSDSELSTCHEGPGGMAGLALAFHYLLGLSRSEGGHLQEGGSQHLWTKPREAGVQRITTCCPRPTQVRAGPTCPDGPSCLCPWLFTKRISLSSATEVTDYPPMGLMWTADTFHLTRMLKKQLQ